MHTYLRGRWRSSQHYKEQGTKALSEEKHAPETLRSVPPSQSGFKDLKQDYAEATVPSLINAIVSTLQIFHQLYMFIFCFIHFL